MQVGAEQATRHGDVGAAHPLDLQVVPHARGGDGRLAEVQLRRVVQLRQDQARRSRAVADLHEPGDLVVARVRLSGDRLDPHGDHTVRGRVGRRHVGQRHGIRTAHRGGGRGDCVQHGAEFGQLNGRRRRGQAALVADHHLDGRRLSGVEGGVAHHHRVAADEAEVGRLDDGAGGFIDVEVQLLFAGQRPVGHAHE